MIIGVTRDAARVEATKLFVGATRNITLMAFLTGKLRMATFEIETGDAVVEVFNGPFFLIVTGIALAPLVFTADTAAVVIFVA